jgi:hypothetical protein
MSLLNKIKEIFAAEEVQPTEMANLFVKTTDGVILMVKAETLLVEAEIVMVDEAGVEQPLLDGEYTLEDGTEISVLGGKIAEVATAEAEVEEPVVEEVAASAEEIKMEVPPAGDYTLDNGDVISVDENGAVINWVKATAMEEVVVEAPVVEEVVVETPVVNELAERVKELEALITNKDNELKVAKEAFAKLSSAPAVKPVDTKKFEKIEKSNGNTTLLSKVSEILSKG